MKIAYCWVCRIWTPPATKSAKYAPGLWLRENQGGNDVLFDINAPASSGRQAEDLGTDGCERFHDPISALHYLRQVEDCNLQYIEQPLPIGSLTDMCALRNRVGVPLAINEDCYMPGNFLAFVRAGAIDAAVMDMEQLGGIGEIVKMAALARQAGVPGHHCGFDMGLKTAASCRWCVPVAFTHPDSLPCPCRRYPDRTAYLARGVLAAARGPGWAWRWTRKLEKTSWRVRRRFI